MLEQSVSGLKFEVSKLPISTDFPPWLQICIFRSCRNKFQNTYTIRNFTLNNVINSLFLMVWEIYGYTVLTFAIYRDAVEKIVKLAPPTRINRFVIYWINFKTSCWSYLHFFIININILLWWKKSLNAQDKSELLKMSLEKKMHPSHVLQQLSLIFFNCNFISIQNLNHFQLLKNLYCYTRISNL